MVSFGNAASSHSGLIPLKTAYKRRGNCSGRSRVRRILLTCIQLLLIQFLEVIWSMPKNFTFFQKPLDKFFYKFGNLEINHQEIFQRRRARRNGCFRRLDFPSPPLSAPGSPRMLFRLYLKTFVAPFLPARLTAPRSPRMVKN